MQLLSIYQQALQSDEFIVDPNQERVVAYLQRIYNELIVYKNHKSFLRQTIAKIMPSQRQLVRGLYLWGGVGAGKTWLMDIFYDALPFERKLRMHFHRFMSYVHEQLKLLQGKADPLKILAKKLAADKDVLCFDEFVVADITDAMLLANLLESLFAAGITLVTTSNIAPDDLYRNGLQRGRFLPAIELIKKYTEVVHLQSLQDYRLRILTEACIYYSPITIEKIKQFETTFMQVTHERFIRAEKVTIAGREISTVACANQVVWFEFNVLCHVPRSQLDYLEIAQCFHTVFLSNMPQISSEQDDLICYLIRLVDVFYDAKVKLIILAAVPLVEIYTAGRYTIEFQRTLSRLLEMQSQEYLRLAHAIINV